MNVKTDRWIDEHSSQLIESLRKCLMIKSVKDESTACEGAPFGTGIANSLKVALECAEELGLTAKNLDGYCGVADCGEGEEQLGILAHLDVVPEGDGWTYPPYGAEIHDGRLYARGVLDDKGSAYAAMFALAAVKESGFKMRRSVRVIMGCDEESGMECLKHYAKVEKEPDLSFSPDAEYPLVNSEKMIYNSYYKKAYASALRIKAGTVPNAVPGNAICFVPVCECELKAAIEKLGETPFKYDVKPCEGGCELTVTGLAAHASMPQHGKNAFLGAMDLLKNVDLPEEDAKTVKGLAEVLKFDMHGESFGIDSTDASGRLTANVGVIDWDETGIVRLTMDIRAPITANGNEITEKLAAGFAIAGVEETAHDWSDGYYIAPESELVTKLMDVYRANFNDDKAQPMAMGGGTYARHLHNAVAFGPERAGEVPCIHMADENIRLDHFIQDTKILADAIIALACEE